MDRSGEIREWRSEADEAMKKRKFRNMLVYVPL